MKRFLSPFPVCGVPINVAVMRVWPEYLTAENTEAAEQKWKIENVKQKSQLHCFILHSPFFILHSPFCIQLNPHCLITIIP